MPDSAGLLRSLRLRVLDGTCFVFVVHSMSAAVRNSIRRRSMARRFVRFILLLVGVPILLAILVVFALYAPSVQDLARSKGIAFLKKRSGLGVNVERLRLHFPLVLELNGVFIPQKDGDTLFYARRIAGSLEPLPLLRGRYEVSDVVLDGVRAMIEEDTAGVFNFYGIIAAFQDTASADEQESDTTAASVVSLSQVRLRDVRVRFASQRSRTELSAKVGELMLRMEEMDAARSVFHIAALGLSDAAVQLTTASGPSERDTYPQLKNPFDGLDITLMQAALNNVAFGRVERDTRDSMHVTVRKGYVRSRSIDLAAQRFDMELVSFDALDLFQLEHDTSADAFGTAEPPWLGQHDGYRYWTRGMDISADRIDILASRIGWHRGSVQQPRSWNNKDHLLWNSIGLHAHDVRFNDDRIGIAIDRITGSGPGDLLLDGGLELHADKDALEVSDGRIRLDSVEVACAVIAGTGDPERYYQALADVPFELRTTSEMDQRSLFALLQKLGMVGSMAPTSEKWSANLRVKGIVRQVDTVRVLVQGDRGTEVEILGHVNDLLQWPAASGELEVKKLAYGEGCMPIIRSLLPPETIIPSELRASATCRKQPDRVQGTFDLDTDLGAAKGSIVVDGSEPASPRALQADIDLLHVALGRYLEDTGLAPISAHLHVKAERPREKDRKAHVEVKPTQLFYRGEDLTNLSVTTNLDGDSLDLSASVRSPALSAGLSLHARAAEAKDTLDGSFELDIDHCDLHWLAGVDHALRTKGRWMGSFLGSTDGELAFALSGNSVSVANDDRSFDFERLALHGGLTKDTTYLSLDSDALTFEQYANAPLDSVLTWTTNGLTSFFNGDTLTGDTSDGRATLSLEVLRPELLTGFLVPSLRTFELKRFEGEWGPKNLRLEIDLPHLVYDSVRLDGLDLTVRGDGPQLDGVITLDSMVYGAYAIRDLSWAASSAPGALFTRLLLRKEAFVKYDVPVSFRRDAGQLTAHIENGLVLDSANWEADQGNLLRFTREGIQAEQVHLNSGAQSLDLHTSADVTTIELRDFRMGSLLNIIEWRDSVPLVAGLITGEIGLPASTRAQPHADLLIQAVMLGGKPLGDVSFIATSNAHGTYRGELALSNGPNKLEAEGTYNISDGARNANVSTRFDLPDISFLEPFAGDLFFDLAGNLNGVLDWHLVDDRNQVQGDLRFKDALVGLKRTGALYALRNEHISADENGLHLDRFTVRDSLGSEFVLNGDVLTGDMRSFRFDLDLSTDSFQLLNSAQTRTSSFYGVLFASADVHAGGTDAAPVIKGDLRVLDGTDLSVVLPGSKVQLITGEGVVAFTSDLYASDTLVAESDAERVRDSLRAQLPELDLDVAVKLDTGALFHVVLDPTTGDEAYFQGDADLHFQYTPGGRIFLNGPFTASSGGYTLDFYGLVKKKFDLIPGSTVTWDGDPAKARLDVQAKYVSSTAAYPLVANATGALPDAERNRLSARMPFEVRIHANGSMTRPAITFGLDLPRMYRNSYPKVNDELERLAVKGQEEERNRQVFGLLVLNSFIQDEATGGAKSSGIASSAARGSVNGILTDQLNKLTGQYVRGVDIELGVNTVDQTAGSSLYRRTSVDYKVSKRFMNERLSFEVGGSVGVDENRADVRNVSSTRAAQYAIMYDLSRDGRFRLRGFYENAFDLYDGDITDNGVALMYTRDFEENEEGRERDREQVRRELAQERARQRELESEPAKGAGPKDPEEAP